MRGTSRPLSKKKKQNMGEYVKMKMSKADEQEFEKVMSFIQVMDELFMSRSFFSNEDDWRDWDDDNEEKKLLLEIEKEIRETEGELWDGSVDNRLVLYEFIKTRWRQANYSGSFDRIVMDASVLIDNVCDPNLDYLEYKPEIAAAISEYEEKHKMEEGKEE